MEAHSGCLFRGFPQCEALASIKPSVIGVQRHGFMDLSYFKINKLLWRWSEEDGACIARNVSLSLDSPPPAREEPTPPPVARPKKPKPQPQVGDGLLKVMELHSRFKTWLETPDPPKPAKPPKPARQGETVPPFDIQEIPAAMRKMHLPVSAALMQRWFAGELNFSPAEDDEAAGINQEGKPYPQYHHNQAGLGASIRSREGEVRSYDQQSHPFGKRER
ncbi:MAG: hypothetical protein QOI13_3452, partial [Paraburkholderia sp.]|nr:hypothetical protein [Paraburkholderia sp.]